MQEKKVSPLVQWWVTPKLPYHDIYELPLLIDQSEFKKYKFIITQWTINPIKRRIARAYLKILQKFTDIIVIGITGSAGKTTTKEMLYSILKLDNKTVCTRGFIDPVYNIPNTILKTPWGTKYLILEMGVEYPGEMDYYLWLARPNIGIITNIFPTHVEFFGDADGVFKEKSKLVKSLGENDIAILNSGDTRLKSLDGRLKARIEWFSANINPLLQNKDTAAVVSKSLGISEKNIKKGLESYSPPAHRLIEIKLKSGARILDDSYNSNLKAALASLTYFNKNFKGSKIALLGEMKELGNLSMSSHRELGKAVAKSNFNYVIGVGELTKHLLSEVNKYSKKTKTLYITDYQEIEKKLKLLLIKNTSLFVKGARSLRLDKIVDKLS